MTGWNDAWCTPPEVCDPLAELFGGPVDVDPCSNARSLVQAHLALYAGGLVLPWMRKSPGSAYQNDPYSQSGVWTDKMLAELASGNVTEIVRLSMMCTSTHWWAAMCTQSKRNPRILGLKRLSFLDPRSATPEMDRITCRFEPALTYFGPRPALFTKTFAHLTRWATWGR